MRLSIVTQVGIPRKKDSIVSDRSYGSESSVASRPGFPTRRGVRAAMRYVILALVAAHVLSVDVACLENDRDAAVSSAFAPHYFLPTTLGSDPAVASLKESWYSSFLAAMKEPSLLEGGTQEQSSTYRLMLVISREARSYRLQIQPGGTGILTAKSVVLYAHKPATLTVKPSILVHAQQVQQFLSLMQKADFWSLETEPMSKKSSQRMDAALWIMEGSRSGEYHLVDRWATKKETDLGRACLFLMKLSQAQEEK